MKNFPIKSEVRILNYALYLLSCDRIRKTGKPCLKSLQRSLRPTCKTTLLGDSVLTFRIKKIKNQSVKIIQLAESFADGVYYFDISSSKFPNVELKISAVNSRELMSKINYSYNLLDA